MGYDIKILATIRKYGERMARLYYDSLIFTDGRHNSEYFMALIVVSNMYEEITGVEMFSEWLRMARDEIDKED